MVTKKKILEILKHWGLENEPVSDVCNGRAFYVGRDYVLKFSPNADEVRNAALLCGAIKDAGKCFDLCIPSLLETADGRLYVQDGEQFFHITRRVSGVQMAAHDFYEGDYAAKSRFFGEIIGNLHLILRQIETPVNDANLYETVKNWAIPKLKDILPLSGPFCRDYLHDFEKLYAKLPRQIIHRDPNPSNIIVSQDGYGFIDFDLSEKNARIYDPCYGAMAILSESFNEKDETKLTKWLEIYQNILSGYDSVIKLTSEECNALPYVIMANQFISTAWFSGQEEYREIFDANKRMTLWIMKIFDKLRFHESDIKI